MSHRPQSAGKAPMAPVREDKQSPYEYGGTPATPQIPNRQPSSAPKSGPGAPIKKSGA